MSSSIHEQSASVVPFCPSVGLVGPTRPPSWASYSLQSACYRVGSGTKTVTEKIREGRGTTWNHPNLFRQVCVAAACNTNSEFREASISAAGSLSPATWTLLARARAAVSCSSSMALVSIKMILSSLSSWAAKTYMRTIRWGTCFVMTARPGLWTKQKSGKGCCLESSVPFWHPPPFSSGQATRTFSTERKYPWNYLTTLHTLLLLLSY